MTGALNSGFVMPKVAVVTDSIACLTRELTEQYGIKIIPLNFYAGDQARLFMDLALFGTLSIACKYVVSMRGK